MSITTRLATVADAVAIANAHVRAWQVAYQGLLPAAHLDGLDLDQWTEGWAAILRGEVEVEGVPRPADYVAELDGEVVGFADVGRFRDEPTAVAGELWAMYVRPDQWGTGAGAALMSTVMHHLAAEEFSVAYLWVLEGNARARRFYEKHGWARDHLAKELEIGGSSVSEVRYSLALI